MSIIDGITLIAIWVVVGAVCYRDGLLGALLGILVTFLSIFLIIGSNI